MKATQIQFNGVGQMEYVERELPPLKENQLLIKVETCGLCTWERYIYEGLESMPFPFVGGHEIAGRVAEKGKGVSANFKEGMPVAVAKWLRCNECEPCRRGYDNFCEANFAASNREYSGPAGFADYLICNSYEAYPFNPDAPIHFASLAEPVACATRALNRMVLVPGDTVVVMGAGFMGILFMKLLKLRGMKTIVVQRSEARRKTAEKLGADRTVDPRERSWVDQVMEITNGVGAAGIVYTAGGGQVLNECLRAARIGTTILMFAPTHEEEPALKADFIHFRELTVTGSLRHDKESFRQSVRLLGTNLVDFSDLNLVFGDFRQMEKEMKRANEDRSIHRILLRW